MLDGVDVNARAKRLVQTFPLCPLDDFLNGKISSLGTFSMK